MDILSTLRQRSWIMKSAENRCAFVRAEYVEIILLMLQWINSHTVLQSKSTGEQSVRETVSDIAGNESVQVASETAQQFDVSHDLRYLDEIVDSEVRLLVESDCSRKQHETEV